MTMVDEHARRRAMCLTGTEIRSLAGATCMMSSWRDTIPVLKEVIADRPRVSTFGIRHGSRERALGVRDAGVVACAKGRIRTTRRRIWRRRSRGRVILGRMVTVLLGDRSGRKRLEISSRIMSRVA